MGIIILIYLPGVLPGMIHEALSSACISSNGRLYFGTKYYFGGRCYSGRAIEGILINK